MKTIKVKVTEQDIRSGQSKCKGKGLLDYCSSCPVATALYRMGFNDPKVYHTHLTFDDGKLNCKLPKSVGPYLKRFDESRDMVPFSFEIEIEDDD